MKIRVTSISDSSVGSVISKVTVSLEDIFSSYFESKDYGYLIDQFVIIIISVDDDYAENNKYFTEKYRRNIYKSYVSDDKVNYIETSILIPPSELLNQNAEMIIKKYIKINLGTFLSKVPKKFDSPRFLTDFLHLLDQ